MGWGACCRFADACRRRVAAALAAGAAARLLKAEAQHSFFLLGTVSNRGRHHSCYSRDLETMTRSKERRNQGQALVEPVGSSEEMCMHKVFTPRLPVAAVREDR